MNILFDLLHPSDVNLFKNTILTLPKLGHKVFITFRERGALKEIAQREFSDYNVVQIGKHRKGILQKIFSIIEREFKTYFYFRKNKINIVVSQGLACGISCKLLNIKILHYDDDSEYKLTFYLGKWFSDIDVMPDFMTVSGRNFVKYKGFKELAYLHPDYFTPATPTFLSLHNAEPFKYIFIREISNTSMNYLHHKTKLYEIVEYLKKKGVHIVLSLENKELVTEYSKSCTILKEPIKDLHSLIYYSQFVISSGDTMAREACLLGVPCIYTGERAMQANEKFINLGIMYKMDDLSKILSQIDVLLKTTDDSEPRNRMRELIRKEYTDTNKVILDQICILQSKI
jgi:uncharacterized protein